MGLKYPLLYLAQDSCFWVGAQQGIPMAVHKAFCCPTLHIMSAVHAPHRDLPCASQLEILVRLLLLSRRVCVCTVSRTLRTKVHIAGPQYLQKETAAKPMPTHSMVVHARQCSQVCVRVLKTNVPPHLPSFLLPGVNQSWDRRAGQADCMSSGMPYFPRVMRKERPAPAGIS